MRHRTACLIALLFIGAISTEAIAQSVVDRAKRDELFYVEKSDPVMASAMRQARTTLPTFFELAKTRRSSISTMAIKVGVREGDDVEYFWINPFEKTDSGYAGTINNTPRSVKSVKYRDRITFQETEIVDWTYTENGKMYGNYTACAILKRDTAANREAFKQKYGLDCATY